MKKLLLAAMGTMLLSSFASASTITQTIGPFNYSTPGSQNLTLDGFDSTLGTLNSVTLNITISEVLNNTIFNASAPIDAQVGNPDPLNATATTTVSGLGLSVNTSLTTPSYTGPVTVSAGNVQTVGTATSSNVLLNEVLTSGLSAFLGGSNFVNLTSVTSGSQNGSLPNGQVFEGNNGNVTVTAQLIYDYTAPVTTPEPSSLLMMGSALVGLGALKFRKRS